MFRSSLSLLSLALMMSTSACYITSDDDYVDEYVPTYPGDMTLSWRFDGLGCFENPDIQSVRVHIDGEVLANDGIYPCSLGGVAGVTLHDFGPGYYSYDVEAIGYGGEVLYGGSSSFIVDGDVHDAIDLSPAGYAVGDYALISWAFPPNDVSRNPSCSQAGVTDVEVRVDGSAPERFRCSEGASVPGIRTPTLAPGSHDIELRAMSADGYVFYAFEGRLEVRRGSAVSNDYLLGWDVGGVAIDWKLKSGGTYLSCAQAGIQSVTVNFMDDHGQMVYGSSGDAQACDAPPVSYDFLTPGTYRVFISASGPGGSYLSDAQNAPHVTVRAGVFAPVWEAVPVTLYHAN